VTGASVSDWQVVLFIGGFVLVFASLPILAVGLARTGAVVRRERHPFAIIRPALVALAVLFVGSGLAELGIPPAGRFALPGLINIAIGVTAFLFARNRLATP